MGAQFNEPLLAREDKLGAEVDDVIEQPQCATTTTSPARWRMCEIAQAVLIIGLMVALGHATWRSLPERGSYLVTVRLRLYRSPLVNHFGEGDAAKAAMASSEAVTLSGAEDPKWHSLPAGGKAYQMLLAFTWRWEPPSTFARIRASFGNFVGGLSPAWSSSRTTAAEPEAAPEPLDRPILAESDNASGDSSSTDAESLAFPDGQTTRTWVTPGRDDRHKVVHSVWRYHFVFHRGNRKMLRRKQAAIPEQSENLAMH